jgi:hypothetical protein
MTGFATPPCFMRDGNEGGGVGAGWLATSSLLLLGGRSPWDGFKSIQGCG